MLDFTRANAYMLKRDKKSAQGIRHVALAWILAVKTAWLG